MPTEEEFLPSISSRGHEFNWTKWQAHFVHVIRKEYAVSELSAIQIPDNQTFESLKLS